MASPCSPSKVTAKNQTLEETHMRLSQPRIAPLSDAEMGPEQKEALKDFGADILNIFRTLVRAPKALTRFNAWGG